MCQAPSISFTSSPCSQPVEGDPLIPHCPDAEAGSGRGRNAPRSRSHQGRLEFEPRRWTKTGRQAASPSTCHGRPPGPGPESPLTRKRVWTVARQAPCFLPQQTL